MKRYLVDTVVSCTLRGKRQTAPHRTAVRFRRLPLTAVPLRCSLRFVVSLLCAVPSGKWACGSEAAARQSTKTAARFSGLKPFFSQ